MNLLFVNQHYPPDSGATGKLVRELSEELARKGHRITVLTGRPTYREAAGARAHADEIRNRVRVVRVPLLPRFKNPGGRALHYLSFALGFWLRGLALPRPDAILAFSSTPMFGGVAARALAWIKRCPYVYCVQDVYPEIAVALGLLRNRGIERVARFLETKAWQGAARVVLIARDLVETARARGVDPSRVAVIPNWADPERILPTEGRRFRRELGIDDEEFVVEYAGNFGRSQDLEAILTAARLVEGRTPRPVRFLLVGGGSLESEWSRSATGVPGVTVVPVQPESRLSEVLAAADLALVPLRKGLTRYCVPSKVYSILASGRPVGAVLDEESEVARIVEESGCGFRVDPDDVGSLADEILRLAADPGAASRLGRNGRTYGEREGSLRRAASDYESLFSDTIRS